MGSITSNSFPVSYSFPVVLLISKKRNMDRCNLIALLVAVVMAVSLANANLVKRQSDWPPAGVAGVDYPTYDSVPEGLQFSCDGQIAGYFADPATQCQVWHWCLPTGQQYSFLCPKSDHVQPGEPRLRLVVQRQVRHFGLSVQQQRRSRQPHLKPTTTPKTDQH